MNKKLEFELTLCWARYDVSGEAATIFRSGYPLPVKFVGTEHGNIEAFAVTPLKQITLGMVPPNLEKKLRTRTGRITRRLGSIVDMRGLEDPRHGVVFYQTRVQI